MDEIILDSLVDKGLVLNYEEEQLNIDYAFLRVQTINIKTKKVGMFKSIFTDKENATDDDIEWIDQPISVEAVTENGETIPIYLTNMDKQLTLEHEVIDPRE